MKHTSMRLGEPDIDWLARYGQPQTIQCREDLELLRSIIAAGEAELEQLGLSENETKLIYDALVSTGFLTHPPDRWARIIRINIEVSYQDTLDKKWDVDGASLLKKLDKLSTLSAIALWNRCNLFFATRKE